MLESVTRKLDSDSLIGTVIASRYRVEARIGKGATGKVYRARHVKLGRLFAIKVLHPRLLDHETTRRRFAREAELAGALHHPNVVGMVDVGETAGGLHYLVMEYAPGDSLYDLIVQGAPLPGDRVIAIVRQLCDGLEHAHGHGLIHRDFKPENVIVVRDREGDRLKIVDFGVAILRDEAASSSAGRLTTAGVVVGTPDYMAPEQALGRAIDHRADLFALGVMCFEMLTGRPPFDGDGVDIARANVTQETPAMSDRAPGVEVDPLLEAFTEELMMKSPDDRPASAAEARALLDLIERDRAAAAAVLGVDPPGPPPVSVRAPTAPLVARWPAMPAPVSGPAWGKPTAQIAPPPGRRAWLAVAAVMAVAALIALAVALRSRRTDLGDAVRTDAQRDTVPRDATAAPPPDAQAGPDRALRGLRDRITLRARSARAHRAPRARARHRRPARARSA